VTWLRSKGRYNINANYTYGKSLGNTSAGGDQFNVNDNYGILGFDRRQAFNLAYSIELEIQCMATRWLAEWSTAGRFPVSCRWQAGPT